MSSGNSKSLDYLKVTPAGNGSGTPRELESLISPKRKKNQESGELQTFSSKKKITADNGAEEHGFVKAKDREPVKAEHGLIKKEAPTVAPAAELSVPENPAVIVSLDELSYSEQQKLAKKERKKLKDDVLLSGDSWLVRNGHTITYICLYLFSAFVFFRPYELIPQLAFLQTGAFILALATLIIYLPTQFATEGNLSTMTVEVKSILLLAGLALFLMPISKDFATSWGTFNDIFIKAVTMFVVMVNVLRTRRRLMGIMWISFGISIVLSYMALGMYMRGELKGDGYRVVNDFGGMMNNPNDWALHLVTMIPLVMCLGIASKSKIMKLVYFSMTLLFLVANTITYSRGGFLGLLAALAILVWKLGRRNRFRTLAIAGSLGLIFILVAPGNYGERLLSIFIPSMDGTGSSDERRENLIMSIIVTLRNPWGVGIGTSPLFGIRNLQTHNAYTQVSSELGLLGLGAYLTFIVSPIRKLGAIERKMFEKDERGWLYYLAIGLQASLVGYMVASFFGSVAYNWFIYYLVAYAVSFRRIYTIEQGELR